jgi:hypothetical protein
MGEEERRRKPGHRPGATGHSYIRFFRTAASRGGEELSWFKEFGGGGAVAASRGQRVCALKLVPPSYLASIPQVQSGSEHTWEDQSTFN